MRNKLITIMLTAAIVASGMSFAFADGDGSDAVFKRQYKGDYTSHTEVLSGTVDPGRLTIEMNMNDISWLMHPNEDEPTSRSSTLSIRTDAAPIDINESLPNLSKFATAERIAQTSLVGYTFSCNNIGGEWDTTTGQWTTDYNDPKGRIRTALAELSENYLYTDYYVIDDKSIGPRPDHTIRFSSGAYFQYGNSVLTFTRSYTLDDLYDPVNHEDAYASMFGYAMQRMRKAMQITTVNTRAIKIHIPADEYPFLQLCRTNIAATKDIDITIIPGKDNGADPLPAFYDAMCTAKGSTENKYAGYSSDQDAIINSGLAILNELIGVLAQSDTEIIVGSGDAVTPADETTTDETVADFTICSHKNIEVYNKKDPDVFTTGNTGRIVCTDCGRELAPGTKINPIPAKINFEKPTVTLKTKQVPVVDKVTYSAGDSIESVKSSNTGVVKAAITEDDGIQLSAQTKAGSAVVTVTLASGEEGDIKVKVNDVACTGIKIKSGTKVKIKKGKSHQIKAVRQPANCFQKITYKSANKKIAKVSSKGKIKGVKKGKTTITVKCGKKTKKIKVTVK
ncbi:MAG: hypothetical protein E7220_01995 [Clostridiales bacterium]|nr:hypothetical protein [Clostridiales bacterium]